MSKENELAKKSEGFLKKMTSQAKIKKYDKTVGAVLGIGTILSGILKVIKEITKK